MIGRLVTSERPRPSSALRERVFAGSDGVCQRPGCDTAITLETFHVSHLRAHANGGVLDSPNLEAWCSRCNLTLGARDAGDPRVTPREWQLAALDPIVKTIESTGAATVSAAPGAGKTVFAGLAFEQLKDAGIVERMLVFVPNRNLVEQWCDSLHRARHLQLKPHSSIERSGQAGCVVTYQSLRSRDQLKAHLSQVGRQRTLLVLDEVHHLAERPNGALPAWASNIAELAGDVETHNVRVAGILNLSGTLWRSMPGERISTVRYRTVEESRLESLVDFDIPMGDLVSRGELRPLDLYRLGTRVRLADYRNLEYLDENMSDLGEGTQRAALASLAGIANWRSAFVTALLDRLEYAYRALEGYHVKALIVAARQDHARSFRDEVDKQMRQRGLQPLAALAISDESDAQSALQNFREQRRVGVLCTVGMAGEGYDCPEIAVVGYASNKLTSLYVRQVAARGMRVTDKERELQRVIPTAIVLPDAPELVEQMVSYLAPVIHEVEVPSDEETRHRVTGDSLARARLPRYGLEDAQAEAEEVTVPYSDGSREDVDANLAALLVPELERANIPGLYAPRVIAASRRTVASLQESHPFDRPSADAAALDRLVAGLKAVNQPQHAAEDTGHTASIEEQAEILRSQLNRLAKWWQVNGSSPASYFNRDINDAAGIDDGQRGSASVDQLQSAVTYARERIERHCEQNEIRPPRIE